MNQYTVSDMVAALRYYEDWKEAIQNGDNDREDLPEVEAAIEKWYAALKAVTDALPDPGGDPWKQKDAAFRPR